MMATQVEQTRTRSATGSERNLDWNQRFDAGSQQMSRQSPVNVGPKERNVSMAAGAIVALEGLSRMTVTGLLSAAVGGYLIYRGATGHCAVYQSLGLDTYHTYGRPPRDEISEKGVHV